ncbi:YafY family transcriptional regulator [Amycolatopsis rhizosphaerae]|uniref:YafY family transcriptional regulator n=1 Tax=Amycolatopsis rhizosphaerae TaxID=2053003 RepID=A0A558CL72_9PSEU|nr:YafY family protein [Amycolatopsis rhizosphaerae]TVT49494.1 YafY family transcriptional regulator [Amycolatopsis rhizosphaerae]
MRASRLVSLLMLLQARGRMTAQELAEALEVSVRTVYRDVDSLSSAGVPVYGEPGHDGGYRLLDGYRTRLTGLTAPEAESLFLTGVPGAAADLGLTAAVTAAQLKLRAALPAELADRAGRVAERFHLDTPPWYREGEATPHLPLIANAVWERLPVRMRYLRWEEPRKVTRTVDPHGLVLKAGQWYLVARAGSAFRTYRVSRILAAEVLTTPFDRAEGFDLAAHWASYLRGFDQRRYRDEAAVRLSPRGLERLPELLEAAVVAAARTTAEAPDSEGWTTVRVPIESTEAALAAFLQLGADAEVLTPAGLRARMIETIVSLGCVYATNGGRLFDRFQKE